MSDEKPFELADDPAPTKAPPPAPPSRPAPTPPRGAQKARRNEGGETLFGLIGPKRKRRLLRYVPMYGITFALIGWFFIDAPVLYLFVGALVGIFAGWSRRGEVVMAIAGTVAALGTPFLGAALGFPMQLSLFAIVAFITVGFVFGVDSRLNRD